jgi:hypothetical protein
MSISHSSRSALFAAATLAATTQMALAAGASPELPPGKSMASSPISVLTHDPLKIITTYISAGNGGGSALAAGVFNFVESRTVDCNKAGGCVVGQESMVQINPGGGNWAICLSVNASYTTCQFQGHLPDTGTFVVGNARGTVVVPFGIHTVQTDVFTSNAGTLAQWQTDHRLYKL